MGNIKGSFYEYKACQYLALKGYKILAKNLRTRTGEIDIVGRIKNTLSFIEVKARSYSSSYALPEETITSGKIKRIVSCARFFEKKFSRFQNLRFDVVGILQGRFWRTYKLLENAFNIEDGISRKF